jgi:hypothetical protein
MIVRVVVGTVVSIALGVLDTAGNSSVAVGASVGIDGVLMLHAAKSNAQSVNINCTRCIVRVSFPSKGQFTKLTAPRTTLPHS